MILYFLNKLYFFLIPVFISMSNYRVYQYVHYLYRILLFMAFLYRKKKKNSSVEIWFVSMVLYSSIQIYSNGTVRTSPIKKICITSTEYPNLDRFLSNKISILHYVPYLNTRMSVYFFLKSI